MRPLIYATADRSYYDLYGLAFLNSAKAHGHDARVFRGAHRIAETDFKMRAYYAAWRYQVLPEVLEAYPAALVLDVDTIIQSPIEIEDEYDLGIYLRPWKPAPKSKTMAGIFYCTDRAMEFAVAVSKAMAAPGPWWGRDQAILWNTYQELGSKYRVKLFDQSHMNWEPGHDAPVWTRGRPKEQAEAFAEAARRYA